MIPENGAKKREGKGHLSGGLFPPVNTGNVGKVRRLLTASQMKIGFVRDSKQDVAISGYSIDSNGGTGQKRRLHHISFHSTLTIR